MADKKSDRLPARSSDSDIQAFIAHVAKLSPRTAGAGKGRLIFALDATASREPTWDRACDIQAEMFTETAALGTLLVQLVYYRGFHEMSASPFESDAGGLLKRMTGVRCLGGRTQIGRVLAHALAETARERVNALVFVGDAFEEPIEPVCDLAGQLGLSGVPVFMFHEGHDAVAGGAFRQIATLSGGAYCRFDTASARILRDLLKAVAVFAVGGYRALEDYNRRAGRAVLSIGAPHRG